LPIRPIPQTRKKPGSRNKENGEATTSDFAPF
jgi:hypothetical protein